jgi:hypothetical protein
MFDVLRIQWTIIARTAPQPWLACRRCGETRRFRSSDRIRVNANGKRVDAWLIYKCTACGDTWNRPILERRPVRTIDPDFLMALHVSEPTLTRKLAFDVEGLRQRAGCVETFDDALVVKSMPLECTLPARRLDILCSVPEPVGLRVDRLLANELRLSRSRIQRLAETGDLVVLPSESSLRRPVREGMRLVLGPAAALADRAGFEPAVAVTPRTLSKRVP